MIRKRKNINENLVDLTGASDIIFTLLLFYILTQNFLPSLNLSLPEIHNNQTKHKLAISVVLERDGTIIINKHKSTIKQFKQDISKAVSSASETINILADKDCPAGNVIKILDQLQTLRLLNITFQGKSIAKDK